MGCASEAARHGFFKTIKPWRPSALRRCKSHKSGVRGLGWGGGIGHRGGFDCRAMVRSGNQRLRLH